MRIKREHSVNLNTSGPSSVQSPARPISSLASGPRVWVATARLPLVSTFQEELTERLLTALGFSAESSCHPGEEPACLSATRRSDLATHIHVDFLFMALVFPRPLSLVFLCPPTAHGVLLCLGRETQNHAWGRSSERGPSSGVLLDQRFKGRKNPGDVPPCPGWHRMAPG